jgi:hypothetical protein
MTDKTVIAKVVSKDNDDIDNIVGLPQIIQSKQASLAFLPKHLRKVRGQVSASTKTWFTHTGKCNSNFFL